MDCERYEANVFDVIKLINSDYPRGGMKKPGFTAGTCLRKDFAFSEERSNSPGMLLAVSRVNESVPLFLVDGIKRRIGGSLRGRKVAVLGLAFKRDTDDERDSLSHKLIRLLERELADVVVHDPFVPGFDTSLDEVLTGVNVVIVATNHSAYSNPAIFASITAHAQIDCLIVDPWNVFQSSQVFGFADEQLTFNRIGKSKQLEASVDALDIRIQSHT
jgi:UDP-N-acetyl-D-mannosaminuronic acid dehydrogenase